MKKITILLILSMLILTGCFEKKTRVNSGSNSDYLEIILPDGTTDEEITIIPDDGSGSGPSIVVNSSTLIPIDKMVTISFTESIDARTVDSSSVYINDPNGNPIPAEVTVVDNQINIIPNEFFLYDERYTIVITTEVKDIRARSLTGVFYYIFPTEPDGTTLPEDPTLLILTPANGAVAPITTAVAMTFSEPITGNVSIILTNSDANTVVAGITNILDGILRFVPQIELLNGANYTATLQGTVEDFEGNIYEGISTWRFSTVSLPPVDSTPPTLTSLTPTDGEIDVDKAINITMLFDENIANNGVTLEVRDSLNALVLGTNAVSANTLNFNPTNDLTDAESYTVTVQGTIEDIAGNVYTGTNTWSFTVAPLADTIAPVITLLGANPQTLERGSAYVELNASTDDGSPITIDSATVDMNTVGEYNVTYNAIDASNNQALEMIRTVIVVTVESLFSHINTLGNQDNRIIGWLELVDLDRDGDLDILYEEEVSTGSSATGDWNIKWYQNKGDGTYEEKVVVLDTKAQVIHAGDINGDGYNDIVYGLDNISYCINDKNASFDCTEFTTGLIMDITSIKSGDVSGNSKVDIIFTSHEQNALIILQQNALLNFNSHTVDANLSGAISVDVEDIDNDGDMDFVAAGETNNARVNQYINDGSGNFTKIRMSELGNIPASVSIADINDVGYADAIVAYDKGIHWLGGSLVLGFRTLVWADENITNPPHASSIDINGDGSLDIVSNSNESSGEIVWYETTGFNILASPNFKKHIIDSNRNNVLITQGGDMDGDNDVDVVAGDAQGNIFIYENQAPISLTSVPSVGLRDDFIRDNNNDTVEDNLTGLIWEDGNSVIVLKTWNEAITYCNGKSGKWRLPSVEELISIVNRTTVTPAIQGSGVFQNVANDKYWSATDFDVNAAWLVNFDVGRDQINGSRTFKDQNNNVRCVKGKALKKSKLIRDDTHEIVIDKVSGLEWMDDGSHVNTTVAGVTAENECLSLVHDGKDDWRLPSMNELYFLADRSGDNPTVPLAFKYTGDIQSNSVNYWSSTLVPVGVDVGTQYSIDFVDGNDYTGANLIYYRCVRER